MTIEELINAEGDNIEFKLDLPQKDIGFLKTVVAFSNGQGGKIVFGIRNEDHVIIGMDDETLFQDIDTITNIIADNCEPLILPSVYPQTIGGKTIIVAQIPVGRQRPYYVKKLGMIDQGSTSLNVSYQNYNYQIGSQIPFEVEIDNSQGKSKVKSVDIKLIRRIQYIRQIDRRIMFNLENIINTKSFAVNVPSNTVSQKFNYVMEINDTTLNKFSYMGAINPYPKLGNLFYAMPSAYSNIIRCEYFLVVSLDFSGLVTKGYLPKVILPIVLNHDPGKEKVKEKNEGIEEDEDLKKAIEASLEDMKKVDDINIINIKDDKNENKENKEIKENEGEINIINEIKNEKENEIKINNINNINNENNSSEIIKEDNKNEIKEDIKINNINNINNEKPEDDKDINNPTLFSAQNNNKNLPNNFSINDFDEDNESNMSEANKKKKTFSLFD